MRRLVPLIVCLLASLAWAAGTFKVGDEIPGSTALTLTDGRDARLSSYEGSAVVLFFYGTWTRHAADEAKEVDALRKARAKQKLVVVGIARDAKAEDAKKFAEDNKLGFVQAIDAKSELYGAFATKGLPWIAVIDAKRKLRYSAAGIDDEAIDAALTELLGAKETPPEKKPDAGDGKR